MKEQLISFDTAKLAKEKKLKIGSTRAYIEYKRTYIYDGDPNHRESYKKGDIILDGDFYVINGDKCLGDYSNEFYEIYEAPTQSLLQKWLREKHNMHIRIESPAFANDNDWICSIFYHDSYNKKWNFVKKSHFSAETYELVLEEGLQNALKLI